MSLEYVESLLALQGEKALAKLLLQGEAELGAGHPPLALCAELAEHFPDKGEIYDLWGRALRYQGDRWGALAKLEQGVNLSPDSAGLRNNFGVQLLELGKVFQAETHFRQSLELKPDYVGAMLNLAGLFRLLEKWPEAESYLTRALAFAHQDADLYNDLGEVLRNQKRLNEALACHRRALDLDPESPGTNAALAQVLREMNQTHEAAGLLRKFPQNTALAFKNALCLPIIPASAAEIDYWRQHMAEKLAAIQGKLQNPEREVGQTSFHLAYHGLDDLELQRKLAKTYLRVAPDLAYKAPHCHGWAYPKDRPLRIGFISRHFRAHTISKLNRGFIERLDRKLFTVFLFQIGGQDAATQELAQLADHFISLNGPFEQIRHAVAECGLDALYFPDIGMEPTTYFLAFARLAPLQLVSWGHPMTTGLSNIDCFMSGDDLDTPEGQSFYSEELIRRPGIGVYFSPPPPRSLIEERAHFNLKDEWRLYACPQSLFKFHPDFDQVIGQIMEADPDGHLVIVEQQHPLVTKAFMERLKTHCDISRVVRLPSLKASEYFSLLNMADCLLDPLYFGGGVTSFEGFAFDLPVVTLPDSHLRGRITYAAYKQMGIEGLIAKDRADYVNLALRIAQDKDFHQAKSAEIRASKHRLFQDETAIRGLEDFIINRLKSA